MKTELELRQLRVFAAVVDAGRRRARPATGLSQSTVSETLSALERTLGVGLFRKAAKGMALTASGEILLGYARRMSWLTSELVGALADASTDVKATLVVSAVESVGAYVLPSRLAALRARWPAVRVEVLTGAAPRSATVSPRARAMSAWCSRPSRAAQGRRDPGEGAAVDPGRPDPLVRGGATPDELRRCDFYMCDAAGDYHQALRQHFDAAQVPAPRMQAMGTIEGVKRGILAGGTALGLLPEHAVEPELRDGVLTEVRVSPALPGGAASRARARRPRSPVVDDLEESLRGLALRA